MSFQQLPTQNLPPSASLSTVIQVINKIVNYLNSLLQNFIGKPQFSSILLSNVSLTTGLNMVPHTLNTTLTGWQIVRQRGFAILYDDQDDNPNQGTYLYLVSSQPVVVDILVF